MKKILIITFTLLSISAFGQLDTVDLTIRDFGVPSRTTVPDFMGSEMYKVNQAIRGIDSINNFIDVTDSSATLTVLIVDSISTGAIYYSDTYWDDLRIPLTNTRINPANSEPDFEDMGNGAFAWGFDANADSAHTLHFIAQLPHRYTVGTDIEAHIHWSPSTTNTGNVRWKLTYRTATINGTISAAAYKWVVDAADGTAFKHQLAAFGTIDGSGLGISSMIIGRVARTGDIAADSYTGSAYGLEIDFHFQIDRPGSGEEYIKY